MCTFFGGGGERGGGGLYHKDYRVMGSILGPPV